tara:strand:- start:102 stop:278 length:177 start_codon:yes stop_codon:yes gene_type:complete
MNIKSAQYYKDMSGKNNIGIETTIDDEKVSVPLDPANRHYAEILKQVEAGTLTIEEAD